MNPIGIVAKKRGYDINFSSKTESPADIGIYNTHLLSTGNIAADYTIGMVNSVDDGYDSSFFYDERWSRYDIGLLIGDTAAKHWQSVSWSHYVRPTKGVYKVGWPKSDYVYSDQFEQKLKAKREELGLTDGTTAIYAPAEESEGKMFEFLEAADGVVDHLVIKHKGNEDYSNVDPDKYNSNLLILDSEIDVFVAFGLGDILVSEKSGVFLDAIHVDAIPVSVTDWPVNLGVGRQFPDEGIPDFVVRTTRAELNETLKDIRNGNIEFNFDTIRDRHFANLGESAEATMDVIETVLINGESHPARVEPKPNAADTSWMERQYINGKVFAKSKLSTKQQHRLMDLGAGEALMKLDDIVFGKNKEK